MAGRTPGPTAPRCCRTTGRRRSSPTCTWPSSPRSAAPGGTSTRPPGGPAAASGGRTTRATIQMRVPGSGRQNAMRLRPMLDTAAEFDRADRLLMTAYNGPSRRRELCRYLAVQPDGWFVIADGDDVAAIAQAIAYGSFCWLGPGGPHPARGRAGPGD